MIKITNLSVEFITPIEKKIVLKNVNLQLNKNNLVAIVGISGSGKSTLLDVLSLNNLSFNGSYYFNNSNVKVAKINDFKKRIVYLNQGQALFSKLNAYNNTKLINSRISFPIFKAVVDRFGLGKIKNKNIEKLSGGEKQRVGIIRSISKNCEMLILDEPTSSLDKVNKSYFINEIDKYKRDKLIIIATHDQELVDKADIVISLVDGALEITKKNKAYDYNQNKLVKISSNSVVNLLISDLLINKKRLVLFISAMSNGILGLLMGFVIVSGFESMFISILVDQVATELSIVYPNTINTKDELNYKNVYLSKEPIIISGEYFNLIDARVDLFNNAKIDNKLANSEVILHLDAVAFDDYNLNNMFVNTGEITFNYKSSNVTFKVAYAHKSEFNSLTVSQDFHTLVINGLRLSDLLIETKVVDFSNDGVGNNEELLKLASSYRLEKNGEHVINIEEGEYLNSLDLDNFRNYLICNPSYKIYCDLNAATAYASFNLNGKDMFIKILDDENISISSEIYKNLYSRHLKVTFNNDLIVDSADYSIFESSLFEMKMPYSILVDNLKSNYGQMIQADYLLVNKNLQSNNVLTKYKILSPYEDYLESFQEILDAVFIGFLIYSLISLLLGIVTVSILIILELDSRRKHIGTLMLLGWTSMQIRVWIVSNAIIKTILTIITTLIMINISINTLNVVIKEVSDILIEFNYPPLNFMLLLIISLLLIIGNISLFHVNYLLKNSPKKLISEI